MYDGIGIAPDVATTVLWRLPASSPLIPSFTKQFTSADQLLARISSFVSLSSDTEFGHYQEPQWAFLLGGEVVSAHVAEAVAADATTQSEQGGAVFQGGVLSVQLEGPAGDTTIALGMVLVDPAHRRKGIARRLIKSAMLAPPARYVLAVCSEAGYPLYRSLGFQDAGGMVYAMSCSLRDLRRYATSPFATNNKHGIRTADVNDVRDARDMMCTLDQNATGYDRRGRLNLLLDAEYASGASSRSVIGYYDASTDIPGGFPPCAFAISRRDSEKGPIIVGPMVGPAISALPLLCHISQQHHPQEDDSRIVSVLVSNHKEEVVDRFLQVEGFAIDWTGPAMTTDGLGIYKDDSSYLALMHPTLG